MIELWVMVISYLIRIKAWLALGLLVALLILGIYALRRPDSDLVEWSRHLGLVSDAKSKKIHRSGMLSYPRRDGEHGWQYHFRGFRFALLACIGFAALFGALPLFGSMQNPYIGVAGAIGMLLAAVAAIVVVWSGIAGSFSWVIYKLKMRFSGSKGEP